MLPNTRARARRSYAAAVVEGPLSTITKVNPGKTVAVVETKRRGQRRRFPAVNDATATAPSTADIPTAIIQPVTTNTHYVKDSAHKAPVTVIASKTRSKTSNSINMSMMTVVPEAPKTGSMVKEVLYSDPSTTDNTLPVLKASNVTRKKRQKAPSKKSVNCADDTDDSGPDTVKKPAKKKVQRYQGPNGSTVRRIPMHEKEKRQPHPTIPPGMTEEEYSQAIKSSSNKVLLDLLARNDCDIPELTIRQHKVKLLTWQVGTQLHSYTHIYNW